MTNEEIRERIESVDRWVYLLDYPEASRVQRQSMTSTKELIEAAKFMLEERSYDR